MEERTSLYKNSITVMLATVVSRIFGLVRVQVISFLLGTTRSADIWGIVFITPDLLRRLMSEGALTGGLIPLISRAKSQGEQRRITAELFWMSLIVALVFSLALWLALPSFFNWLEVDLANGIGPGRLVLIFLFFSLINAVGFALLYVRGYFFLPSIMPVFLSVLMILGGLAFHFLHWDPVWGLAWGVSAGGFVQFSIVWLMFGRDDFSLRPFQLGHPFNWSKLATIWLPAVLGGGVFHLNLFLSRTISVRLFEGAVAALEYATRLTDLAMGLIVTSIGSALLPLLVGKDHSTRIAILRESTVQISFLTLPACVGLILAGYPMIGLLFGHGAFDEWSQILTYGAMMIGCFTLIPFGWSKLLIQSLLAEQEHRLLLGIATLGTALNVLCMIVLPGFFPHELAHLGINASLLILGVFLFLALSLAVRNRFGFSWNAKVGAEILKNIIAAAAMIAAWWPLSIKDSGLLEWIARVVASVLIYALVSFLLKAEGLERFLSHSVRSKGRFDHNHSGSE